MKAHLSPAFRGLGLRGSAGRYSLPVGGSGWALLGLQKSTYSDKAEIQFTGDLLIVSLNLDAWRKRTPSLPGRPARCHLRGRRASDTDRFVAGRGADTWWRVLAGPVEPAVAEDVIRTVGTVAVPWLREHAPRT